MTDTTVWALATATHQPLEVVIFQAVAYKAWKPGGHIDSEWAESLTQVLSGSQPWRRAVAHHAGLAGDTNDAVLDLLALDADSDPLATFASTVLATLGERVTITDPVLAERLAAAGLGELTDGGFTGYPDELATWSQLAHGDIGVEDLDAG